MARKISTSWSPEQMDRINARRAASGKEEYTAKRGGRYSPNADYIRESYMRAIGSPQVNPFDSSQANALRMATEAATAGKATVKTVSQMQGMGLSPEGIDPLGYGYSVVETESERRKRDPNSEEFRMELMRARQREIDAEMKRRGGFR